MSEMMRMKMLNLAMRQLAKKEDDDNDAVGKVEDPPCFSVVPGAMIVHKRVVN